MSERIRSRTLEALDVLIAGLRPDDVLGPLRRSKYVRLLEAVRGDLEDYWDSKVEPMAAARRGTGKSANRALRDSVLDLRARRSRLGVRAIANALKAKGATVKVVRMILSPPLRKRRRSEVRAIIKALGEGPVKSMHRGDP